MNVLLLTAAALVAFAPPANGAGPVLWTRHAADLPEAVWAVEAIDADGDDRRELIAVGTTRVWALDPATLEPRLLAATPGGRTIHAVAWDADRDGDEDLAVGRSASDWIAYREAVGAGKTPTEPTGADWTVAWLENPGDGSAPWSLHALDRELHGVHGVAVGDVDGDGAADLLADSFAGPHLESSLAWFPAAAAGPRDRRLITEGGATGRPHYLDFADMDGDGRGDVLLGASAEGTFTWWEQPADLSRPWRRHLVADLPGATHPRATDLNGDGRFDLLGSAGHGVGVWRYPAPNWEPRAIDESIRDVHAFDAADLDGDGDVDAAGCSFSQGVVRWWENRGGRFVAHDVDVGRDQQAYDLRIDDLDHDGRADLLLAGRRSDNVVWYRNETTGEHAPEESR